MKDGKFNEHLPAYPVATHDSVYAGLTKREIFAAMAMQGFVSNPKNHLDFNPNDDAKYCCDLADALLAELERTK